MLVHVAPGPVIYGDEVDIDTLRTVSIDLRSGDTRWERRRWFPVAFTGDTVIGVTANQYTNGTSEQFSSASSAPGGGTGS